MTQNNHSNSNIHIAHPERYYRYKCQIVCISYGIMSIQKCRNGFITTSALSCLGKLKTVKGITCFI